MKKLALAAAVALTACQHAVNVSPAPATGTAPAAATSALANQVGAVDAPGAVSGFLGAAKAQNISAMSSLFGGSKALLREIDEPANVERRFLTMMCYLRHDSFTVVRETPSTGGTRVFEVQFTLGKLTRSSNFTAVPNGGGRWFVQEFDPAPLTALCAKTAG